MSSKIALDSALKWMLRAIVALVLLNLMMKSWAHQMVWLDDESLWTHVVESNPEAHSAHFNLGKALSRQDRQEEALAMYSVAVERNPLDPKVHIELGAVLLALGHPERAEYHLSQALELAEKYLLPKRVLDVTFLELQALRHDLALREMERQRYKEALVLYQKLLALDPNDATALGNMGVALYYLNRSAEALKALDQALSLDPSLEDARTNRAAILQQMQSQP